MSREWRDEEIETIRREYRTAGPTAPGRRLGRNPRTVWARRPTRTMSRARSRSGPSAARSWSKGGSASMREIRRCEIDPAPIGVSLADVRRAEAEMDEQRKRAARERLDRARDDARKLLTGKKARRP